MDMSDRRSDPETEREQVRLWRAWRTILEMCKDRVNAPCFDCCLITDMRRADKALQGLRAIG